MTRYEEKVYRSPKKQGEASVPDMKSQLVRLKQDLEQFQKKGSSAALTMPLQERIRDLEGAIAHAQRKQAAGQAGGDDDDGPRYVQKATSSRFPPRGSTGRS